MAFFLVANPHFKKAVKGKINKKTERESDELKIAAVDFVMQRIPEWVLDEEE